MTETFFAMWQNTQQTLLRTLDKITDESLTKRLRPEMRSLGVIMMHIGESQFMFAKTLFGIELPPFTAQTLGKNTNPAEVVSAEALHSFVKTSCNYMSKGIQALPDEAWQEKVMTPWKAEMERSLLLNFVIGHSMQHLGQVIQALKYGEVFSSVSNTPEVQ